MKTCQNENSNWRSFPNDQTTELAQADDLGGDVFKKRLNENMQRSIILAKTEEFWVFAYLLAKKD